ncbi:MAG: hypothetical protein J2P50_06645 [Hyphomicrobiaceae bacterium]|nr:hypothetical protein [Hyphomicrobiaceae bacterium]
MANELDPRQRLEPFATLIGDWSTEATHPATGDTLILGRVRFEWLAGERFLIQRAEAEHPAFPQSICLIGVMEGDEHLSMQYFDSRGTHRRYGIAFDGKELRIWRQAPGFAQRFTATVSADGSHLEGVWQLNEADQGFRDDLKITYRRSS